jgi:hypothetical protein
VDIDEREYYFTVSELDNPEGEVRDRYLTPVSFPDGLVLKSMKLIPGDEVIEGKAVLPFTPNGMLYSFIMIVEDNPGRQYLLQGNHYNNLISVLKLSPDDEGFVH